MIVRLPVQITAPSMPGPGVNMWHVRDGSIADDHEVGINEALGWIHQFYTACQGIFPSGTTISFDGTATEIGTATPAVVDGLDTFTVAGTAAAGGLPAANCLIVNWRTALATRRGRGRTFLGPLATSIAEANGTPEESNRSAVNAAIGVLVGHSKAPQRAGVAVGIWSPTDGVLRDVVGGDCPNRFGVLRSRRD